MPTTPEAIAADIAEAATAGFRGRLIARGQARAIIWRDGALPPGAPAFAPQLSYDLHSYGYALLGLGLRLLELGGDATRARTAFEQAATALESVIAKGILECLRIGVALHHGALPTAYRKEIERLLRENVLKVTISSPTLAQGLNLYATVVIFHSLYRNRERISDSEFRNVVGR